MLSFEHSTQFQNEILGPKSPRDKLILDCMAVASIAYLSQFQNTV